MTDPSASSGRSRDVEGRAGDSLEPGSSGNGNGHPEGGGTVARRQSPDATPLRRRSTPPPPPPPPPPRPRMSDSTPPPVPKMEGPTGLLLVTRYLWILSFLVGLGAVAIAFLSRGPVMEDLLNILDELAPAYSTPVITTAASIVFWSILVALGVVIGLESLLLAGLLRRKLSARLGMLLLLVLHIGVALLADSFLAGGDQGWYLRIFLAAQLLLAAAGLVVSVLARGTRPPEDQRGTQRVDAPGTP